MAKKTNLPICAVCKKEIIGRTHAVFNPPPEYGLIQGLRQCFKCLAESSNINKLK